MGRGVCMKKRQAHHDHSSRRSSERNPARGLRTQDTPRRHRPRISEAVPHRCLPHGQESPKDARGRAYKARYRAAGAGCTRPIKPETKEAVKQPARAALGTSCARCSPWLFPRQFPPVAARHPGARHRLRHLRHPSLQGTLAGEGPRGVRAPRRATRATRLRRRSLRARAPKASEAWLTATPRPCQRLDRAQAGRS